MITLELQRIYHTRGVNGMLRLHGNLICYTIELPWLDNRPNASCVPEGRYRLLLRQSEKFSNHLWLQDVPDRSLILIHPANNAARELRGCIAPVSALTGKGIGENSRPAMRKLMKALQPAFELEQEVWLQIASLPVGITSLFKNYN
jgi:hypothetical protein